MKRRGIVTTDLLLKMNMLLVCLFLFYPSPLTCSNFALHYKEYFALLLSLALGFLLILKKNKEKVICFNRIDFLLLVFFSYALVNFRSFSIEYFGQIIVILLAYFVFRNLSVRFLCVCFILVILSSLVQVVYCWLSFAYPWEALHDIEGIFYNTGIWGGFVAMCSVLVCGAELFVAKRYRIVLLLLFVLFIYIVYESSSRAAWLAIFISLSYFFYVKCGKNVICKTGMFIGFLLFVIACFPKMYNLKAESALGRIYIWKNSLFIIKENILLGTGQGGFQVHYMTRQAADLQKNALSPFARIAGETDNPFNGFIKITVEYGILGLALFIALLYNVFNENSNKTTYTILFKGLLVGILVFAFFSYPFMYPQFQLLFVMCIVGISHNYNNHVLKARMLRHTRWIIVLFLFAIFPILKYYYYSIRWECCIYQEKYSEDKRMEEMSDLYPTLKTNATFLTYYAYLYSERKDYVNSVPKWKESLNYKVSYRQFVSLGQDLEQMGEYDKAEACWKMASHMIPSRFTPIYLQIEMAMKIKELQKADSLISLFLMMDKKVDSPNLERMNENVVKWKNQIYRNL